MDTSYVSSASEANVTLNIRKGDMDYLMRATTISIYWFIDCKYFGPTNDLNFLYNFTNPDASHILETIVVASYDPPTTLAPITTLPITTTIPSNTSISNVTISNITMEEVVTTTDSSNTMPTVTPVSLNDATSTSISSVNNISLPWICSSIIPPDPNKTYGHFTKKIDVRGNCYII